MAILLKNCSEIVVSPDGRPKYGENLSVVNTINNCDLFIENGKIKKIGCDLQIDDSNKDVLQLDWYVVENETFV